MEFKNVDIRTQVNSVKGKWYYEDYKDRLKINKHSVIFDEDFAFKLHYVPTTIYKGKTKDEETEFGTVHWEHGEVICDDFIALHEYINGRETICLDYFGDDECPVEDILETILIYIATCI